MKHMSKYNKKYNNISMRLNHLIHMKLLENNSDVLAVFAV